MPPRSLSALADQAVERLMAERPETIAVFVRNNMACPGCPMAPFMTVADAAVAYDLPLKALLRALGSAIAEVDRSG